MIVKKYNDEWTFVLMCQSRVEGVIIHHLGGTRVVAGCVIVVGEYANALEGRVGPAPKYSVIVYASGPARTRHHSTCCECPPPVGDDV